MRECKYCSSPLIQGVNERNSDYKEREFCGRSCVTSERWRKKSSLARRKRGYLKLLKLDSPLIGSPVEQCRGCEWINEKNRCRLWTHPSMVWMREKGCIFDKKAWNLRIQRGLEEVRLRRLKSRYQLFAGDSNVPVAVPSGEMIRKG